MPTISYAAFARTNVITVNNPDAPHPNFYDVAALPDGGFVVVYGSSYSGSSDGPIRARIFNADGTPRTPEIIITTVNSGIEQKPHVAVAPDGQIGIVFLSTDGGVTTARMQYLDENLNLLGNDQPVPFTGVGTFSTNLNTLDIAATPDGNFVVTAADATQGVHRIVINGATHAGSQQQTWSLPHQATVAQGVLTNGTLVTVASDTAGASDTNLYTWSPETLRDTSGAANDYPAFAALPDGGYAVAYRDNGDIGLMIMNANGSVRAGPILANPGATAGAQDFPSVTALANGMIAVFWQHSLNGQVAIGASFFDANGAALTPSLEIDTGVLLTPSVVLLADGTVALTWGNFASGTLQARVIAFAREWTGDGTAETFNGDALSDIVIAGGGIDTINTQGGEDLIFGQGGDDVINAGAGDDVVSGGAGVDAIDGGDGIDTISAEDAIGGVTIELASGAVQDSWGTTDTITGFENISGSAFNDTLVGDGGANRLAGGAGDDWLVGGGGDDVLAGGSGTNVLLGGTGTDLVSYETASAGLWVDMSAGVYSTTGVWDVFHESIEGVIGSAFADTLYGDANGNSLFGGLGNDTLVGRGGNDLMYGQDGDDWIVGQDGDDIMEGGAGVNVLIGGDGTDLASYATQTANLWINMAAGVYSANGVWDVFFESIEGVRGGSGNDSIFGNGSDNRLEGGQGDDALLGALGNDTLVGGAGSDWLVGGDGDDRLIGGVNDVDVLTGGLGTDVFDLGTSAGWDVAFDFNMAADRFSLGGLQWLGFLTYDADGDGQADDTLLGYAGGNFVALNVSGLTLSQWNALVDGAPAAVDAEKAVSDPDPEVLPVGGGFVLPRHTGFDFGPDAGPRNLRPETPFIQPADDWGPATV